MFDIARPCPDGWDIISDVPLDQCHTKRPAEQQDHSVLLVWSTPAKNVCQFCKSEETTFCQTWWVWYSLIIILWIPHQTLLFRIDEGGWHSVRGAGLSKYWNSFSKDNKILISFDIHIETRIKRWIIFRRTHTALPTKYFHSRGDKFC